MPALTEGTQAPEFSLSDTLGRNFSLAESLEDGPVVLAFLKVSCPTCQFAFPYLEKMFCAMNGKANIVGICQGPASEAELFAAAFGVTFPFLLDPPDTFPVSSAYGITHVPTVFFVSSDGTIELSSVGWARIDMEQLNRSLAESLQVPPPTLFDTNDDIPDFRSGCGSMN
ncbi:MAG: peroxiredoxin family protein [Candidatus Korobacteraceae bacterium]